MVVVTESTLLFYQKFVSILSKTNSIFFKGVYGDILKVKIMYNRRDNALMQFKSCDQAMNGKNFKKELFNYYFKTFCF